MGKRALESLVSRLRKKLESLSGQNAEPALKAVWGIGYQLCVPVIVKA
jgi:DNA-binding response OmpR family regulator